MTTFSAPSFLNTKFSFENFIVGPSNSFAHAVSYAVTESPGTTYNPLFIYSKVGLGKTHLMQAIAQSISLQHPDYKILYISSEKFTNELITSLKNQTIDAFREHYRSIDILLIDDIQFIAGKERTQEEFFHTFNHLYNDNKQIVLSSDQAPQEIPGLEERLISRFAWGIIADIQPPDYETRMAILRKKSESTLYPVPDDVLEFIAQNFTANIRELEGALIRVVALRATKQQELNIELAQEALKETISYKEKRITIEMIQKIVADHFDLSLGELKSKRRHKALVLPRQVAMYLSRILTQFSFPEIGENFGGKDHSTIIHAYEKIKKQLHQDLALKNVIQQLIEKISG